MQEHKFGKNLNFTEVAIQTTKVVLSLLIFFSLCPIFFLYKCLVYFILMMKYGKRFHGMMTGSDIIWCIEDNSRSIITSLLIFEFDKERNGDIFETFKKQFQKIKSLNPKLMTRRKQFMGYTYYLERDDNFSFCKKMNNYENCEDLKRLVSEYSNEPMGPGDDEFLEIIVGTKPIVWIKDSKKEVYPLIGKAHHSLGDGVSMLTLLVTSMAENPTECLSNCYNSFVKKQKPKNIKEEFNFVKLMGRILRTGFYFFPIYAKKFECALHGPVLSGKKHLVWKNESEGYVQKVKYIKNRFQGSTFTSVLLSAISASLSEFFEKKHPNETLRYLPANVVVLPKLPKFEQLVNMKNNQVNSLVMSNKFTLCTVNIPLLKSVKKIDTIVEGLADVKQELDDMSLSLDYYNNMIFSNYLSRIPPMPVIQYFRKYYCGALVISSLPGLGMMKMFHGNYLQDIFFWVPNSQTNGFGVSIFTYDDRFEIGMIADEVLLKADEVQEILDNVYKYIDILHDESKHRKCLP